VYVAAAAPAGRIRAGLESAFHKTPRGPQVADRDVMAKSTPTERQIRVRRYGASLGLVALALVLSRFVSPHGNSAPLVLLTATAAIAYFGGRRPAFAATATAAGVNALAVGLADPLRFGVETALILLLGSILALCITPRAASTPMEQKPVQGEAYVSAHHEPGTPALGRPDPEVPRPKGHAVPSQSSPPPALSVVPSSEVDETTDVVVIHGNAVLRLALRSTLSGLGYRVKDAANKAQAAPMLDAETPEAVVMDVGRVDDPALATVEQLRNDSSSDCLLVILANADAEDDRELLMAAGADVVLRKPIDTAGIAAKLRERLPPSGDAQSRVGLGASP